MMADIRLPEVTTKIRVAGCGSAMVRWQHIGRTAAPVQPGLHIGWIVLLAPLEQREITVRAAARFTVAGRQPGGPRELGWPDAFTIDLPEREPVLVHRAAAGSPRVFVSYAHDSEQHKAAVKALCQLLKDAGVSVLADHNEPPSRQAWNEWMTIGITRSDYVIVVASPVYRSAGLYELGRRTHRGVQEEYRLLNTLLAQEYDVWQSKVLPVVLPGRTPGEIPLGLQPDNADHYVVPSLTATGIAGLLRAINYGRDGTAA